MTGRMHAEPPCSCSVAACYMTALRVCPCPKAQSSSKCMSVPAFSSIRLESFCELSACGCSHRRAILTAGCCQTNFGFDALLRAARVVLFAFSGFRTRLLRLLVAEDRIELLCYCTVLLLVWKSGWTIPDRALEAGRAGPPVILRRISSRTLGGMI